MLHGGLSPPKAFVCKCPDFSCHLQGARYVIEQILSYESWMAFFKDWTLFAQAFGVTVMVSVLALLLALALGVVFGVMSTSHHTLPRFIARGYVETLQNTPLVLQAYVFYLALPYIGVMIGQVSVGIYAVGIYHGAYIAEVVRAGIQSIPKGQAEAAASQGFTYVQTMRWIILPQTIKIIHLCHCPHRRNGPHEQNQRLGNDRRVHLRPALPGLRHSLLHPLLSSGHLGPQLRGTPEKA